MMKLANSKATIRYMDGTSQRFEMAVDRDSYAVGLQIEKLLDGRQVMLQLADRVLVMPTQSIKSIGFSPAPLRLPQAAIRDARGDMKRANETMRLRARSPPGARSR